ncbi:sugar-binding domain-containing protein [Mucilaginibacter sp. AW1-3]
MLKPIRSLLIVIMFSTVCITGIKAQGTSQRKQLFDYDWKFFLGDASGADNQNFDDESWRTLDLPHDWSIEGTIDKGNSSGGDGGFFQMGIGWYRKTFTAPAKWKGKRVSIYFEGVYMNSEVFINGRSLGVHPYGYTTFTYDVTPYLNLNRQNIVAVKVDNSKQKNSRWYSGSGIYRHVWIVVTNPVHIANWGTAITTPEVSATKATVRVKTLIKNETGLVQNIVLKTVLEKGEKKAGDDQTKITLAPNSEKELTQIITVSNPTLWAPETPGLYKARVQILKDNQSVDETKTNFGIRSLKFTTENGFQLNGKTVKINGGCVHHDNGCLGAAAFDRAEERRVEILKAAGFNAIRTSHNPPSEAFLAACDRLGMLVIDEAFDGWRTSKNKYDYALYFNDWWQRDLETMVLRDRNHPSVMMWSIGNEIIERKSPEAVETAKMLANCVRKIDPTRPVTSAMTTWDKDWEIFDPLMAAHDVAGYNYELHRAAADHERVPSRIIVQTESYPKDAFANWKLVQNNSYILGDFVWTALDYLGESGIGRWYYTGESSAFHARTELFPYHGAYCGDIDLTGWRKPISHYRSMLYNNNEKLYMAVREPEKTPGDIHVTGWAVWPTWESWTWPGFEGKDMRVEVYAKYPKVRLYLNNKLIGKKETTEAEEFKATFSVPYAAGELRAVGIVNDKEVESTVLKTAGNATKIKLMADRGTIIANGEDLSYITVEITDNNGIMQPNSANNLQFSIEGPGVIAGVDNADPKDPDPYFATVRKVWHGRALLVIRSDKNAGKIKLTTSSQGLATATITINAKQQ